ncbi:dof zinc finger protein DOF5.7 [Punica granatum]|uniref:Dof zinc finger protein n=2 Tax=Punica granatum TaxID=22663 RepID=A0A218XLS1_PUNGR|nr:dof zinc finger protein DOF5.7 [Punica granatum]OWM85421.1 hypothetical protein CDL15_Pgr019045 [Punica granatum]PKI42096.1 hypothetical protein CRG98_037549 [Punica granatum]
MATLEDAKKDCALDPQNLAPRKHAAAAAPSSRPAGDAPPPPDQQAAALRCPRCDSTNTKFCYYNNYSLSQPRHFCKTCRRYWTKGGALRNVPIGGGCRKNKKLKSSSSASRLSSAFDSKLDSSSSGAGAASPSSSADVPGFRFFPNPASLSPAVDFQLSGLSSSFNRLPMPLSSFADIPNSNSRFSLEQPIGFNNCYPSLSSSNTSSPSIASGLLFGSSTNQDMAGSMNIQSSLASSIESLSSLNQDLHWKLQQQRLAMLFGPVESNTQKDAATFVSPAPATHSLETQVVHKPQPVPFQNQEFVPIKSDNIYSRKEGETTVTEWFFGNSYNSLIPDSAEESGNGDRSVQAWGNSNLHQFGANLP